MQKWPQNGAYGAVNVNHYLPNLYTWQVGEIEAENAGKRFGIGVSALCRRLVREQLLRKMPNRTAFWHVSCLV